MMAADDYAYANGRRIGRWTHDPDGTLWLVKGTLDPSKHLWHARNAWGTDAALVEQLPPTGGVRFQVADGTVYQATRALIERYGFALEFGHYGRQWFLPDARWERQPRLLAVPEPCVPAPAPPVEPAEATPPLTMRSAWLTPSLARQWLTEYEYKPQRTYRPHRASWFADLIARDEFQPTPLWLGVLDGQSYLLDGQHRLGGIALGGRSLLMPVVEAHVTSADELATLYSRLDRGMVRTFADIYEAHGLSDEVGLNREQVRRVGNAALAILNEFQHRNAAYSRSPSGDARVAVVREYAAAARTLYAVWAGAPQMAVRRVEVSPVLAVALVTARYQPEAAARFWRNVVWRERLDGMAPEMTLAQWLENHALPKSRPVRQVQALPPTYFSRAAAGAWNAFMRQRSYRQVLVRDHNAPIRILGTPYTGTVEDDGAA